MRNTTTSFLAPWRRNIVICGTCLMVFLCIPAHAAEYSREFFSRPAANTLSAVLHNTATVSRSRSARVASYHAQEVGQSQTSITLRAGASATLWVDFLNDGNAAWQNTGDHPVALHSRTPDGAQSQFRHPFWSTPYRPARLGKGTVKPGETGRVRFALKAPSVPGEYVETFQLVAENLAWIEGGTVMFSLRVVPPPPRFRAHIVGQAFESMVLAPGESATYWVDFQNTGTETWKDSGSHYIALNVAGPAGRASAFRHSSWREYPYRPARLGKGTVKPGETGRVRFALKAPSVPGEYVETFQLVAENLAWIEGSSFSLPIRVGVPPVVVSSQEPLLDVGLRAVSEPIQVRADGVTTVRQGDSIITSLSLNTTVTLAYGSGIYSATIDGGVSHTGSVPFVVTPETPDVILEATNFENRPAWNPSLNDNMFRGSLRLEHSDKTGNTWLINRLPLESYLRGVAETGNESPTEFQRALTIAARSYAHYHIRTATKHADEHFTVDATYDQVYRGYGFERRAARVVQSVLDTRGVEVTVNAVPVLTPYFSQSDGRTRAWEEVWNGGPFSWLVSKSDPACAGLPLLGHGVGMSGKGAWQMALEGSTHEAILAYYYTGSALQKQYD